MASGIGAGIAQGISQGIQKRQDQAFEMKRMQAQTDQAKALEVLRGIIGGNLTPTPEGQNPSVMAPGQAVPPQNIGQRIMQGLGVQSPQMTASQGYTAQPSLNRQLQQSEIDARNAEIEMRKNLLPLDVQSKQSEIGYRNAETEKVKQTTPVYIQQQLQDIDTARQGIELKKQQIANDATKTDLEKQQIANELALQTRRLDIQQQALNQNKALYDENGNIIAMVPKGAAAVPGAGKNTEETQRQGRIAKLVAMRNSLLNQKKTFQGGFLGTSTLANLGKLKNIDAQVQAIDGQIQGEQMGIPSAVDVTSQSGGSGKTIMLPSGKKITLGQ